MREQKQKRWIVKDAEGRIFGPFVTEQVLEQIDRNYFLGGELIASYPGGDWIPISKSPEFYDRLLDALAAEAKDDRSSAKTTPLKNARLQEKRKSTAEDEKLERTEKLVSQPAAPAKPPQAPTSPPAPINENELELDLPEQTRTQKDEFTRGGTVLRHTVTKADSIVDLIDMKALGRFQQLKGAMLPLAIIALGILIVGFLLWGSGPSVQGGDRIRLIAPRKGQPELPEEKIKAKFARALAAFQTDTFNGYLRAEDELIEIVEGASTRPEDALKKADYLSLLCLVYRELWPFAYQDAEDLKVVSEVMREAKRLDPGGLYGTVCEIVHLMLNGHVRDAQGLTDSVLLEKSQAPVLFELRGDLYSGVKDYQSAAAYFERARSLWPAWQKNAVQEGRARAFAKEYQQAIQLFRGVLAKVPDHGVAKIELGLIEALEFNQIDRGYELIDAGLGTKVPRTIAARGYAGIAKIYLKKQQRGRAAEAAKKAFELDPTNPDAKELVAMLGAAQEVKHGETDLMFLGEQYLRAGDYFSAQAQFKAAFEANPKNGMAAMKAAKCLWHLSQTMDAIEWMRKAIRADSKLVTAYVELADFYAQRFDYFEAIETLKRAQAIQPRSYEVYRGFATVELRRNNFKGAIAFGQRALQLYETDIQTLLIMANAHLGLHEYVEAQKYASRALDLDFNEIEAHSLYAKIEAGLHGIDAGVSYLQQMLNRYVITKGQQVPQAAIDLRITLGEIYMQDERYQLAEQAFRQALALDRNSRPALIALGRVLQAQNLAAQALEEYLKAAVLDPSDPLPIFLAGELYLETGNYAEAEKQFERVLRINPRYPRAHAALGRVALRRGDPKRALDEAMQERTINPDLVDAYLLGAEAHFALKQYSNCAAEYQAAVARGAGTASNLVRMARCYRLSGGLDSALSLLREAQAQESGNPDIYKEQGAIFHTRGMADEAIGAYETYLRLAPNAIDRLEVEARINKILSGDMTLKD